MITIMGGTVGCDEGSCLTYSNCDSVIDEDGVTKSCPCQGSTISVGLAMSSVVGARGTFGGFGWANLIKDSGAGPQKHPR
mmetsp:Transcript_23230/g.49682  ORF Transcript_23230/g.49682 Transcript_23230/m.49682 type:complete len:80 (-) Transcript_23230:82-321(-)